MSHFINLLGFVFLWFFEGLSQLYSGISDELHETRQVIGRFLIEIWKKFIFHDSFLRVELERAQNGPDGSNYFAGKVLKILEAIDGLLSRLGKMLSRFEFWLKLAWPERQKIAWHCHQTFCFQFNIKLIQRKTWFFSSYAEWAQKFKFLYTTGFWHLSDSCLLNL
jgi:hypothetical protein